MANLYIVATPIGNLKDITLRAIEILKSVDLILCEDTRVSQKLLQHYDIETPLLSYHQHSRLKKLEYILGKLKQGEDLALISDAGTPGILDPGAKLIEALRARPGIQVEIVSIPGSSALIAAASVAGFKMHRFIFLGFPPIKKRRSKFFDEVLNSKYPVIFYESPHRILKSLGELQGRIGDTPDREIAVCSELTKKFERVLKGKISDVIAQLKKSPILGEFVVVVGS